MYEIDQLIGQVKSWNDGFVLILSVEQWKTTLLSKFDICLENKAFKSVHFGLSNVIAFHVLGTI